MNMMPNEEFTRTEAADLTGEAGAKNPALARLMKAWESKQAKNARKAGGFGFVAVTLAACGGSSSGSDEDDDADLGQVFTLTIGSDTPDTLEADGPADGPGDVFNAPLAAADGSLTGVLTLQTLTQDDVLVGTDEIDTLNATLNGTGAPAGILGLASPSITDIEVFNLTAVGNGGGLDLINSTGYEELWNINSNADLTLANVGEGAVIGLDGTAGDTDYTVMYTSSASDDITSQSVVASGVGGSAQTGQETDLSITDASSDNTGIEDLNLVVSDGVRMNLQQSAANIENLAIEGDDNLVLSADGEFPNLVTLNAAAYVGDLTLDVSGSKDLENVLTGPGDDIITIKNDVVNGDLSVDLGDGFDILEMVSNPGFDADDINDLDFTGGVQGVQNLAFGEAVELVDSDEDSAAATLDLDGVSDDLETVWFFEGLTSEDDDSDFAIANSPVDELSIVAQDLLEGTMDNPGFEVEGTLGTGNLEGLSVTTDGDLEVGNLNGSSLEALDLSQVGVDDDGDALGDLDLRINSDEDHDVSNLETISAQAEGDSTVTLNASDEDADMNALRNVNVAAGEHSTLIMDGQQGYEALEDVVVSADESATVTLTDVYGSFDVDVTAEDSADVTLTNTNAENVSVAAGTDFEYNFDNGDIDGYEAIDEATVTLDGSLHGNPNLTTLEVSGAKADVTLSDDLTSMETIDLTGVTTEFQVDASDADFGRDLGEPGFVTYLIGGTSSDDGDSVIVSSVEDRETFRFTEDEFGTIIIENFDAGGGGDRLDFAELGITDLGQLAFDEFDFNDDGTDDLKITDDADGSNFDGEIILAGLSENDLTSANYTFA